MKHILLISMIFLLAISCKSITGNIDVNEHISLVKKGKWIDIEKGSYKSTMKIKSSRKLKVKIDGTNFLFRVPKWAVLPSENGELLLSSDDSGQPYDLNIVVKTVKTNSELTEGNESCTYAMPYTVCRRSGPYGGQVCSTHFRTYLGFRYSKWSMQTTKEDLNLNLLNPNSDHSVAWFEAHDEYTKKVYEYEGRCR